MGEALADELGAPGIMLGAVPAMHGGKDAVGTGLERHVEVLGDAIGGSEEIDEVLRDIERLDRADAQALDGRFVEDAAEEVLEFDARRESAAVGSEVDTAENDFAVFRFAEAFNFLDDGFGREAAALTSNEGDDTVGAAKIGAILNLERRAGVIPFPTEDGSGGQNIQIWREAAALTSNEGDDTVGAAKIAAILNLERRAGVIPFPTEDGSAEQNILFENVSG